MPDGGLGHMDAGLLFQMKLQPVRSIPSLSTHRDDLLYYMPRCLFRMGKRSPGAILQRAEVKVGFSQAIVPKIEVGPSVTQLLAS